MPSLPNASIYDTNQLVEVVPNLKLAQNFLLDRYFSRMITSDTEFVSIDVDIGKRRMSPFVSPLVEGKLVEQRRYQTNTFKPPYIKDKRAPDLRKPIRRMIGERIGGTMTGAEREQANLVFEMADQVDMLQRRLEWMAAQALVTGTVPVTGDGFPAVVIDFGRDAALTVTLSGSNVWGYAAGFDAQGRDPLPTRNLDAWQSTILKKSGAVVNDIIFTTTPFELWLNAQGVYNTASFNAMQTYGNAVNPGAEITRGAVYKGKWGQYNLWLYNDWYVDANDVEQRMIPDGTIILAGPDLMGVRSYAQIIDPAFNYQGLPYAPKSWIAEDPPQRFLMMQSAPLVIPSRPNASMAIQVCAPVLT